MTSVVDLYVSDLEPATMMRVSCVLANLAAEKALGNVARLLTKADADELKNVSTREQVLQVDRELTKGLRICTEQLDAGELGQEDFDIIIGKFFARSILHLAGKDKNRS